MRIILLISLIFLISCKTNPKLNPPKKLNSPHITMIELGSEGCVSCNEMKKIIKKLRQDYDPSLFTIKFYDIRRNKAIRTQYHVRVMPTQVFINKQKKEIYRHEGILSYDEIVTFLQSKNIYKKH